MATNFGSRDTPLQSGNHLRHSQLNFDSDKMMSRKKTEVSEKEGPQSVSGHLKSSSRLPNKTQCAGVLRYSVSTWRLAISKTSSFK